MTTFRSLSLAFALLAATSATASAQSRDDMIAAPALRAHVTVSGDLVRIGDVIDNAGSAAQIAIYRAPDLGTTGRDAGGPRADRVARASGDRRRDPQSPGNFDHAAGPHQVESKDIEASIARALQHKNGLGDRRQPQPHLRPRRAGPAAGSLQHRRHAGGRDPVRPPQQPL